MANTNVINFHVRLPDGTEQIQFGELFRLTEGLTNKFFLEIFFLLFKGLTNKCVGILQRARKHRSIIFIFELLRS